MQDFFASENPVWAKPLAERPGLLILLSGLLGFFLFALVFPTWTDNVESAQVVAGLVTYPPESPMGLYHLSALSFLIDSAALLLKLGLSEWFVSVLFTGLQGALIFSGLTGLALAFSRSAPVSLALPVLILHLSVNSGVPFRGPPYLETFNAHAYPILMVNHPYIFGTVGLFAVLLVWGLFANGKLGAASFLAGLMVWVHPSMGLACWAGAGAGVYFLREGYRREELRTIVRWFLWGAGVSIVGMGAHRLFITPAAKEVDWELASRIVENYERNWDTHRVFAPEAVLPMLEVDFYVTGLLLALRLFAWKNLSQGAKFLVCGLFAITVIGAAALIVQGYFPDRMPPLVRTFMVNRWLNINSMAFPAIVFGLLGFWGLREKRPLALGFLLLNTILVAALVTDSLTYSSHFGFPENPGPALEGLLFPLLAGIPVLLMLTSADRDFKFLKPAAIRWLPVVGAGVLTATVVFLLAMRIAPYFNKDVLAGSERSAPFFQYLANGKGLMLESHPTSLRLPLLTRRGVLVDPEQIDIFTYSQGSAPAMEEIFKRVYGRTLLRQRAKDEPISINQFLIPENWENFSMADWQAIKRDYGVTDVLVPYGYPVRLPFVAGIPSYFSAYHIPDL